MTALIPRVDFRIAAQTADDQPAPVEVLAEAPGQ
jgi:hypothetical protein